MGRRSDTLKREWHVIVHGQSLRFRFWKYVVIIAGFTAVQWWMGWTVVWVLLSGAIIVSLAIHFLFRWKTKAWTQSWGPYKKIV